MLSTINPNIDSDILSDIDSEILSDKSSDIELAVGPGWEHCHRELAVEVRVETLP